MSNYIFNVFFFKNNVHIILIPFTQNKNDVTICLIIYLISNKYLYFVEIIQANLF